MSDTFPLAIDLLQRREPIWGTAASLGVHAVFIALLLWLSPLRQIVVPPPTPVAVEIVTQQQFDALQTPAPAPKQLTAPAPTAPPADAAAAAPGDRLPPLPQTAPAPEGTHVATEFYAANILREPGMEKIRRTFGTLAGSEKLVQICNIEGLEQIRRVAPRYDPDTLVPYAMTDMAGTAQTLIATGGAFRSRRKWFGVSFQCTVTPDYLAVAAFEFKLGEAIPEDQWEAHNLNAEDSDE